MEFRDDSKVALYLVGKPQVADVRVLQCINVNKSFVSRTSARYWQHSPMSRKWTKKTATSAEMLRNVKKQLDRNPRRSGQNKARKLSISQLNNELGLKPLKIQKVQDLTEAQKKVDS